MIQIQEGSVYNDPRLSIDQEGFQCPLNSSARIASEPHDLWCVTDVVGDSIRLAAASMRRVEDNGFTSIDATPVLTGEGQRIWVLPNFSICRHRHEVVPPGGVDCPVYHVLPASLKSLKDKMLPCSWWFSACDWPNWHYLRLVRSAIWNNGGMDCTVDECIGLLDDYFPPYEGNQEEWEQVVGEVRNILKGVKSRGQGHSMRKVLWPF